MLIQGSDFFITSSVNLQMNGNIYFLNQIQKRPKNKKKKKTKGENNLKQTNNKH